MIPVKTLSRKSDAAKASHGGSLSSLLDGSRVARTASPSSVGLRWECNFMLSALNSFGCALDRRRRETISRWGVAVSSSSFAVDCCSEEMGEGRKEGSALNGGDGIHCQTSIVEWGVSGFLKVVSLAAKCFGFVDLRVCFPGCLIFDSCVAVSVSHDPTPNRPGFRNNYVVLVVEAPRLRVFISLSSEPGITRALRSPFLGSRLAAFELAVAEYRHHEDYVAAVSERSLKVLSHSCISRRCPENAWSVIKFTVQPSVSCTSSWLHFPMPGKRFLVSHQVHCSACRLHVIRPRH
ncbi:hypothetical protein DFH08DRAFT_905516 [Mycena albidolilacea]|uniref:Uncharacterized protein n=1 Tax=Mycena albidolilacea TaxID=1033008 RepID=A0AAD6YZT1_9AGAR|nr:hypothetical protein DFH08DRAFT_905516 [Mycena albidolilacea]